MLSSSRILIKLKLSEVDIAAVQACPQSSVVGAAMAVSCWVTSLQFWRAIESAKRASSLSIWKVAECRCVWRLITQIYHSSLKPPMMLWSPPNDLMTCNLSLRESRFPYWIFMLVTACRYMTWSDFKEETKIWQVLFGRKGLSVIFI